MRRNGWTLWVLALAGLTAFGCASIKSGQDRTRIGVPESAVLIGGGNLVEFRPPVEGIFILADSTSGKMLMSKTVAAGELVEVNAEKQIVTTSGLSLADTRLLAYFVPLKALRLDTAPPAVAGEQVTGGE